MRPIAIQQDVIRYPLNDLFGAAANVRLLRVLAEETMGPIGTSLAADKAGLSLVGARRALNRLAKTGFVQLIGSGHSQAYVLRESDPVVKNIMDLFRNESSRYQALLTQIRKILDPLSEIQTAWIDSPPTEIGNPLQIGILSDSKSLAYIGKEVQQRLTKVEQDFDIIIEIRAFSRADAPELFLDSTVLLAGYLDTGKFTKGRTHADRDERAAQFGIAIVKILDSNPSLIKRASKYLEFLLEEDQGAASHDLREWRDIINHYSQQRIKDFLVSETQRAKRLRQSSPFFAVLSPEERDQVFSAADQVL